MNNKILIIDDEYIITDTLKEYFELCELEVVVYNNPLQAIEDFKENLYNIVITDIRMPDLSGIDVINTLKNINPFVQIIVITGFTSMSYATMCLSAGAVDYIKKPFSSLLLEGNGLSSILIIDLTDGKYFHILV